MDIRDRVMGDMPDSFFHKVAGIIPGFNGYMDRERRRDADKLLRTHLARQYSAQRDRLTRVQQAMARSGNLDNIAEVDRMVGVLQRFIDRLSTATYGYTGLFDPVKIEAADLDQLYAFDLSLASGVDQVGTAIDAFDADLNSADPTERAQLRTSMNNLSTTLDELNRRLDQRHDLLSTGRGVPADEYNRLVSQLSQATAGAPSEYATQPGASTQGTAPEQPQYGSAYTGAPTVPTGQYGTAGEQARYPGGETTGGESARYPGGDVGTTETPRYGATGAAGGSTVDLSGTGIETASSPAAAPGAPGEDIGEGLRMENDLDMPDEGSSAQPDKTT